MLKIINKDDLNQLQKDIYDLLQKISTDNHFISSIFLLIKQRETQEALFEFLKNNRGLNNDDVMLKAVANSQRLALHHYL